VSQVNVHVLNYLALHLQVILSHMQYAYIYDEKKNTL
jgi:hypothetical protein